MAEKTKVKICACEDCDRPVWKNGGEHESKCLFHSEQLEEKKEEFDREIELYKKGEPSPLFQDYQRDPDVDSFMGFVFPGKTDFEKFEFKKKMHFFDVTFSGFADFSYSTFPGFAVFSYSTFSGDANFHESTFSGEADFRESTFSGVAGFWRSTYSGEAYFRESTFSGDANFHESTFSGEANFRESTFSGYAIFRESTFSGEANFWRSTFSGEANFRESTFSGEAYFSESTFSGEADFENSTFSEYANFEGSTFENEALFNSVAFANNAIFSNTFFKKDATFKHVQPFRKDSDNKEDLFYGALEVERAEVKGNIDLTGACLKKLNINGCSYDGVLSLIDLRFVSNDINEASTTVNVLLKRVNIVDVDLSQFSFRNAFIREINFDRIRFKKVDRGDQLCGRPPQMVYEEILAREETDKDKKREKFKAAETIYRSLKHVMEKQHAHGYARLMRAGELECKYQKNIIGKKSILKYFDELLLTLYRLLSGYGLKWLRALSMFLVSLLVFALAYWGQYGSYIDFDATSKTDESERVYNTKRADFGDAIIHSFETTAVIKAQTMNMHDMNIRHLEGLQKIVCPILLFLFLQAARNVTRD